MGNLSGLTFSPESSHTLSQESLSHMTPEEHYRRMMSALSEPGTYEEQQQRLFQLASSMGVPSPSGDVWCSDSPTQPSRTPRQPYCVRTQSVSMSDFIPSVCFLVRYSVLSSKPTKMHANYNQSWYFAENMPLCYIRSDLSSSWIGLCD